MSIDGSRVGIAIAVGGFVCSSLPHVILGISGGFLAGLAGILLKSGAQEIVDPEMLKGSTKTHSTLLRTTGAVLFRTKANHKSGLMTNAKRPTSYPLSGSVPPVGAGMEGRMDASTTSLDNSTRLTSTGNDRGEPPTAAARLTNLSRCFLHYLATTWSALWIGIVSFELGGLANGPISQIVNNREFRARCVDSASGIEGMPTNPTASRQAREAGSRIQEPQHPKSNGGAGLRFGGTCEYSVQRIQFSPGFIHNDHRSLGNQKGCWHPGQQGDKPHPTHACHLQPPSTYQNLHLHLALSVSCTVLQRTGEGPA
ncbi:uncharacterized protein B0T23DRAFT_408202 [Neurospora hispaniola]|uniref:Uncharacterized protein n=1 Tax=Neurospora hispaniola TaxID=588809 RepID=A0AAJ0HZX5_9PEZI|nr:hypothetical protein B0T23DRAFT_408202 [Neurospora hispaniola]